MPAKQPKQSRPPHGPGQAWEGPLPHKLEEDENLPPIPLREGQNPMKQAVPLPGTIIYNSTRPPPQGILKVPPEMYAVPHQKRPPVNRSTKPKPKPKPEPEPEPISESESDPLFGGCRNT